MAGGCLPQSTHDAGNVCSRRTSASCTILPLRLAEFYLLAQLPQLGSYSSAQTQSGAPRLALSPPVTRCSVRALDSHPLSPQADPDPQSRAQRWPSAATPGSRRLTARPDCPPPREEQGSRGHRHSDPRSITGSHGHILTNRLSQGTHGPSAWEKGEGERAATRDRPIVCHGGPQLRSSSSPHRRSQSHRPTVPHRGPRFHSPPSPHGRTAA